MDHKFIPSQLDGSKCGVCKRQFMDHTPMATCEACSNSGNMELYPNSKDENAMLLCQDCIAKEREYQSPENQEKRLQENKERTIQASGILDIGNMVDKARTLDYAIQVRQDVYNAETIAHHDVFKAIDVDPAIPLNQKQFKKAEFLQERFEHYQQVIFQKQQELVEFQNRQRVTSEAFNKLANTLREEERNKLRMLSPDYKPGAVKSPKETKPRATKTAKFDKKELIAEAAILQKEGFPVEWSALQTMCVSRQMTPKQAAEQVRKIMGGQA